MTPPSCCAAASPARRCGCRWSTASGRSSGTRGSTPRCATLPGSGIVYVPTVAETERLAGYLRSRGHAVAAYSGQLDTAAREQVEQSAARQRAQGRRRDLGARHGLRQARPRLLRARRLTRLARRLLPAGRPGRAGHRQRRGGAAPGRDRRAHLGVLRHRRASPTRRNVGPVLDALDRRATCR